MSETRPVSDAMWRSIELQLRTYVRSRVEPAWVDDVIGDVIVRLLQNSQALADAANPAAYVQRVAKNAVVDHYRRRGVERKALSQVQADAAIGGTYNSSDDEAAEIEISRCMFPFIADLPPNYRDALTLTEINQLSQKEAAKHLGLSLSGLKSRVQRGRLLLQRAVTQCCSVEIDGRGGVMDCERRLDDTGKGC
ncbi:MAG: sigma-70 family RNA polymerase sigma factor [Hyphomicrobiaceae bacterium]